ncbi:MAG: tripartite tricarboxylate transporter substrate-binding protein [Micropepsaceae bacterium]
MIRHFAWRFGAAFTAAMILAPASAQDNAEDFFDGRTITYIVSSEPGGGYDTYGRLIARHMQKYLPVRRIVVRNVTGAGNIIGANTIFVSRPDGLTFGTFNTGLIYGQLLGLQGIRFDLTEMSWIGKMAEEGRTMVLATNSGFDDIQDLIDSPETIRLASASLGTANHTEILILRAALGLNIRLIPGISGGEFELSMMRGEVAGALNATSSREEFVARGAGKYVLSVTGEEARALGVPQARELVTDPRFMPLLALTETVAVLGRLTAGPPDIPANRLALIRDAYMNVAADPEFLEQAAALNIPIQPSRGDVVAQRIRAALNQPEETVSELKRVIEAGD